MKPFTEQEMIRVAKAAGHDMQGFGVYRSDGALSVITNTVDITIEYDAEDGDMSVYDDWDGSYPAFNILAVSNTIRQILKEREL